MVFSLISGSAHVRYEIWLRHDVLLNISIGTGALGEIEQYRHRIEILSLLRLFAFISFCFLPVRVLLTRSLPRCWLHSETLGRLDLVGLTEIMGGPTCTRPIVNPVFLFQNSAYGAAESTFHDTCLFYLTGGVSRLHGVAPA